MAVKEVDLGPVRGPAGKDGVSGKAATIVVGIVKTGSPGTNVVVKNVGTTSEAVLDFTIPRGDQGERGPSELTADTRVNVGQLGQVLVNDNGRLGTMDMSAVPIGNAETLGGKKESALNVNSAKTAEDAQALGGKTEGELRVLYAENAGNADTLAGKSESSLRVSYASSAGSASSAGNANTAGSANTAGVADKAKAVFFNGSNKDSGGLYQVNNQNSEWRPGTELSNSLIHGAISGSGWCLFHNSGEICNLGHPATLWATVYAKTGTIQTSDRNQKHDIQSLDERYLQLLWALKPASYMLNNAVDEQGRVVREHDRRHTGLIAQDVEEAMERLGLTAEDFAALCIDPSYTPRQYDADGNLVREMEPIPGTKEYSLRYEEFISLLVAGVQQLKQELDEVKQEIAAMKGV